MGINTRNQASISRRRFDAVIFDLDGVVTRTAQLHAQAWKSMFDAYLKRRGRKDGTPYAVFDIDADYRRYVDGKARYDGVQSFLEARAIRLPYGSPRSQLTEETVCGLGNRKDALFLELLEREGAQAYKSSVEFIRELRAAGFKTAVVSASKHCIQILQSIGATELFDAKVDGNDSEKRRLKGKPAPDTFLAAARLLRVDLSRSIIVEDAIAGVEAGRAGAFGLVVGVDRVN
jgi:alpha,alpha-trehalase